MCEFARLREAQDFRAILLACERLIDGGEVNEAAHLLAQVCVLDLVREVARAPVAFERGGHRGLHVSEVALLRRLRAIHTVERLLHGVALRRIGQTTHEIVIHLRARRSAACSGAFASM